MSYYPILNAPGMKGSTTICNFPPNNWENGWSQQQFVNVTWPSDGLWISKSLGTLLPGKFRTISADDLASDIPVDSLALLSLTRAPIPLESSLLPKLDSNLYAYPAWRATLGLSTSKAQTSYQGEIDPFPEHGSLLTFGPLIQFGQDIKNYLILLNIEASPVTRRAELEIYDAATLGIKARYPLRSNALNTIPLDELDFKAEDLPLFICRDMAAIPLYLSTTLDGAYLSLEHTHPPASLVVHGQRWGAQRLLKAHWFSRAML